MPSVDLAVAEAQEGGLILNPIGEGDVYKEVETDMVLRLDDLEVDEVGTRFWEVSTFDAFTTPHWRTDSMTVGYVSETELIQPHLYRLLWRAKDRPMPPESIVRFLVSLGLRRHAWQHGNGVWVGVVREGKGVVVVQIIGLELSDIHVSIIDCPNFYKTTLDSRVGRMANLKTYTFTTFKSEGGSDVAEDVEIVLAVSGKVD